jgi:hypothetical protein
LPEEPDKKKKEWQVDPTMYKTGRRASFLERRIVPPLRQVGKWGLIILALTYPIYLVFIGLVFGGLAFWAFLVGSVAVIGLIIWRIGFSSNFRNWGGLGVKEGLAGLLLGFLIAAGFYAGLIYLKIWIIPVTLLLAGVGLYFVRRGKS